MGLFHLMSVPPSPPKMNSLSGGSQNFICPGGSYCKFFLVVLSTTIVCRPGGLEVLQRFVTGGSSVGGGGYEHQMDLPIVVASSFDNIVIVPM